jgi:hypothetical protein
VNGPRWRQITRVIVLGVLALVAASDVWQVIAVLFLGGSEVPAIAAWHGVNFVLGVPAIYGVVKRAPWAWRAVALWGFSAALLVASLPIFLEGLEPEARTGIWLGATSLFATMGAAAWFVRSEPTRVEARA